MPAISGVVPARFLTMVSHLVVVVTIFWSKEVSVLGSLPLEATKAEVTSKETELTVALSVTIALFAVELLGFLSGVTTLNYTQGLLSVCAHASGSIALSFFLLEGWPLTTYWAVFTFCSALPAAVEVTLIVCAITCKRRPL
ncbi:transmembrane protein 107-like isoform X2 [Petromyzon marinus]|uniref:Transmembrane protein 107 n=1 Tax=Petromyzon marinus TaxID=7757 RepID=A0AAJ7UHS2_PETMA|nr:transmembrane protein 107-like isoform X5 [Petromyzon marinus]